MWSLTSRRMRPISRRNGYFFWKAPKCLRQRRDQDPSGAILEAAAAEAAPAYTMEPTTLLNTRRIGGAARNVDVPDGITVAGVELSKPTELLGAVKAVGNPEIFATVCCRPLKMSLAW